MIDGKEGKVSEKKKLEGLSTQLRLSVLARRLPLTSFTSLFINLTSMLNRGSDRTYLI